MPVNPIDSQASLRKLIAEPPALMKKRLQPEIDEHCLTVIRNASVCAVGFADPTLDIEYIDIRSTPVLQAEGQRIVFAWPAGTAVPMALQRAAEMACSLYFIMPGIGFALRANGRCVLQSTAVGPVLTFSVDALFLHCSRAKVRAQFWEPRAQRPPCSGADGHAQLSDEALVFIAQSPYVLLLSQSETGHTEISPRGDPDGFVVAADRRTLLIPERPGNKVACTLSNVLASGSLTASFLIPGCGSVLSVAGSARLTADREKLEALAINGKVPVVAMVLQVERFRFNHCPQLLEAGLWRSETHLAAGDIPSFPKMLSEHMNGRGVLGKATTLVVDAVVRHDLRHLY